MAGGPPIDGFRLSVDFGTTNTVAALRWPDGRIRPLLFDGVPMLASAVFAGPDGILVGRPAIHAARAYPHCFEPHPKRCIDDGRVMLGPAEGDSPPAGVLVTDLIGAVLHRVAAEALRTAGQPAAHVTLTCPAGWGPTRRHTLLAAARPIFGDVALIPEPVAAASHFVTLADGRAPTGACVLVYDLGAGTFDVSVIRRTDTGFDVLAADGLADAGGLDIDAAVMAHLGTVFGRRDAAVWSRLTDPATAADRRASRLLWDDVRTAKEMLSHTAAVHVHVPLFDDEVPLGREELERLARPILDRTVEATRSALNTARVAPAAVTGLYLVGGGSRIPLAATLLHRAVGIAPTAIDQPELAVAEGGLRTAAPAGMHGDVPAATMPHDQPPPTGSPPAGPRAAPPLVPPLVPPVVPPVVRPAPVLPAGRLRPLPVAVAVAAIVAVILISVVFVVIGLGSGDDDPHDGAGPGATTPRGGETDGPAKPVVNPCLVGAWRATSHVINQQGLQLTGAGATYRMRADGRYRADYGSGITFTTRQLPTFQMTISGTITATMDTDDKQIYFSGVRADGRIAYSGGGYNTGQEPLTSVGGAVSYQCAGDSATLDFAAATGAQTVRLARRSNDPDGG